MLFSCNKEVILREISIANEIISSHKALTIISSVLLIAKEDILIIKATDFRVSFETEIPISLEKPGDSTVFCSKFLGILRNFPDENVFIIKEGEKLTITNKGNISFKLNSLSVDNFPEIPNSEGATFFSLPQKNFVYMIRQTIFAVSGDETRYFMNGVYMKTKDNELVLVATDGRRLSQVHHLLEENQEDLSGIIIPPKVLGLISKLSSGEGNIELAVKDKLFFTRFDKQKLASTLVDGQFPNYSRVIPQNQELNFSVNRDEFSAALRRVSLLSDQKTKRIILSLSQNSIILKSDESEIGEAEEKIGCLYDGPGVDFALNHTYLSEPLRVIEEKEITVEFTESHKAITLISPTNSSFFHIVMPMQME